MVKGGGNKTIDVALKADPALPMGNYTHVVLLLKGTARNQAVVVRKYLWVTIGPPEEE